MSKFKVGDVLELKPGGMPYNGLEGKIVVRAVHENCNDGYDPDACSKCNNTGYVFENDRLEDGNWWCEIELNYQLVGRKTFEF